MYIAGTILIYGITLVIFYALFVCSSMFISISISMFVCVCVTVCVCVCVCVCLLLEIYVYIVCFYVRVYVI